MNAHEWWDTHTCIYYRGVNSDDVFECECGRMIIYNSSTDTFEVHR